MKMTGNETMSKRGKMPRVHRKKDIRKQDRKTITMMIALQGIGKKGV